MKSNLIFFGLVLSLLGCSSPISQVPPNTPPIILRQAQIRKSVVAGTVSVPAGIYEPDFEANNGIYYRAPTHLITKALGFSSIVRGGIFLPNPPSEKEKAQIEANKNAPRNDPRDHRVSQVPTGATVKDFRMGVWTDQQEGSGGLLIYAATSPKRIFRVTEPFIYEIQK